MEESVEADVVVVGAGSAGCVLASRLSQFPWLRVVLIEAGRRDRLGATRLPSALRRVAGNPRFDWLYTSEPDPSRGGRTEAWPRGRTLGGSSAINGATFIRGAPSDFDAWEAMGCTGWGWRHVLPLFRRLETSDAPDRVHRGDRGPQRVSGLRWVHPLTPEFIQAAMATGIPFVGDLNGPRRDGVGYNQGTAVGGRRQNAYDAFLAPHLRRRRNLLVLDDALAERILFEGRRAVGVRIRRGDGSGGYAPLEIRARGGVVLAAGAINSPQLLMLSGIGPAAHLRQLGIAPLLDSPEVGRNLMEHPGLHVQVEVDVPTGNQMALPWRAPLHVLRWLALRDGPVSTPTTQALAFFRSVPGAPECDLQFQLLPYGATLRDGRHREVARRRLLTILVNASHPRSRGWLELRWADPAVPIAIHPRLLEDPADLEVLLHGLDRLRLIATTPPFGPHVRAVLEAPPPDAGREADIAYLRAATRPFLHPAGTCRMGADAASVVDPGLRVRGTEDLWVADASIFPRHVAGNINATALMIGEKAADLIIAALTAAVPRRTTAVEPATVPPLPPPALSDPAEAPG